MPATLDPATLLGTVLEGLGQPFYAVDSDWRITHYNSHAARHFGRPAAEMMGTRVWDVFTDDINSERGRLLFGAMASRQPRSGEIFSRMGRHIAYSIFPLGNGLGLMFRDITDQRRAEAEREKAEETLRKRSAELEAVLETIPTPVWFTNDTRGRTSVCNRRAAELLRQPHSQGAALIAPPSTGFRYCRHGVEVPTELLPLQRAARGEETRGELLELRFDDGDVRTLLVRAATLRGKDGEPQGAVCAAADVTERQGYEEHLRLLTHDFGHRMRNMLATVQSLALESLQGSKDMARARQDFDGRLMALLRAHETLTRERWEGASLKDVIERATAPWRERAPGRFTLAGPDLKGPDLKVPPKVAIALSLGLNELCTNAQRYGALSSAEGTVEVDWSTAPEAGGTRLDLSWEERNGPVVHPPAQRRFGTRLIEQGLAQELGGEVTLDFDPAGVRCRVTAVVPIG
jgi:two-component sensor histidine kinase